MSLRCSRLLSRVSSRRFVLSAQCRPHALQAKSHESVVEQVFARCRQATNVAELILDFPQTGPVLKGNNCGRVVAALATNPHLPSMLETLEFRLGSELDVSATAEWLSAGFSTAKQEGEKIMMTMLRRMTVVLPAALLAGREKPGDQAGHSQPENREGAAEGERVLAELLTAIRTFISVSCPALTHLNIAVELAASGESEGLELSDTLDSAMAELIAALPASVASLGLTTVPPCRYGYGGRSQLAAAIMLIGQRGTLQTLSIVETPWLVALVAPTLSIETFPALRCLDLARNTGLSSAVLRDMLAGLTRKGRVGRSLLASLESLDLTHVRLDPETLAAASPPVTTIDAQIDSTIKEADQAPSTLTVSMNSLSLELGDVDDRMMFLVCGTLLTHMSNLKSLRMQLSSPRQSRNQLTGAGLETLVCTLSGSCPCLEQLYLRHRDVPAKVLLSLVTARMPKLRQLDVGSCRSGAGEWWGELATHMIPQLNCLSLNKTNLSDIHKSKMTRAAAETFASGSVRDLNPFDPEYMSAQHLARSSARVPTSFEISRRDAADGRVTPRFSPPVSLETQSSQTAKAEATHFQKLEVSDTMLVDESWRTLAAAFSRHVPALKVLDISSNDQLTDSIVPSLRRMLRENASSLEIVDLSGLPRFGAVGIVGLLEPSGDGESPFSCMPDLQHLRLHGGTLSDDNAAAWLAEAVPHMKSLRTLYFGAPRAWWRFEDLEPLLAALSGLRNLEAVMVVGRRAEQLSPQLEAEERKALERTLCGESDAKLVFVC
jgi:hypothetical protein